MSWRYGRRVVLACSRCDEIFTRPFHDAARAPRAPFCSKACHAASMRTGRRMAEVVCSGCGVGFRKLPSEVKRTGRQRHYCSVPCYLANVDHAALARAGARAPSRRPVPPAARFLRAQKAGLARARSLSPERLRAIAMKGVAARLAKRATRGAYGAAKTRAVIEERQWVGPLLTRKRSNG